MAQELRRVAVFGGVYNNYLALEAVLEDAAAQGAQEIYCLGDIGGFGPFPDRSIEILRQRQIPTMQGNYDQSIGNDLPDCQCGYTDPRDNHFARISYEYTLKNTSEHHKGWLRQLPESFRIELGGLKILMAHGSPRKINEFLWESTTPAPFISRMLREHQADVILVTHTGLSWRRFLAQEPARGVINVGAIGRPGNNGGTQVDYALLTAGQRAGDPLTVELRQVGYDHQRLAAEMRQEGLPEEFIETILTGWWTTCMEIMPAKERASSRF
jgi:predicted phosphodiesterase